MDQEDKKPRPIRLLPDDLINRIAAGEVIERPSAVLKEVLENSLDAGADRIDIEVVGGGKKLIRVRDNGHGMYEDDLYMALERHATSKLDPDSDLVSIATLGFRGEAMASIGAVSRLSVTSAPADGQGHVIRIEGGRLRGLEPAPANRGTTVEVADLFYNVPARRKFLKTEPTESAHLLEVARYYALSREGLRLTFRDGGREVMAVESRHDFKTRVFNVLGRTAAENLKHFEYEGESGLKISGWLGGPERALKSGANMFMYVLGRPVKDRLLNRALADGYGRLLPPGHWPTAIIFVDLDPADVDVNVHPAKAEVRFRQPGPVFSAMSAAVNRVVGRAPITGAEFHTFQSLAAPPTGGEKPHRPLPADSFPPPWLIDDLPPTGPTPSEAPPWSVYDQSPPEPPAGRSEETAMSPALTAPAPVSLYESVESEPEIKNGAAPGFEPLLPLGQLYDSYILAQGSRGLYLIDQHAAHERILYNQLKETLARHGLPGQNLLFADTMDLSPEQALAAETLAPHLSRLGFDLQPFGDRTFILKAAPAILKEGLDPWEPLMEILDTGRGGRFKSLEGAGLEEAVTTMSNKWLYSLACRAAIKAGEKMSLGAMEKLLADMAVAKNGAYCPHGRPAIQLIDRGRIEKYFDR